MKQNQFADVRSFLGTIRTVLSDRGIVSASWNGEILTVTHAIPETGKQAFCLTFDNPMEDYQLDANALILEFMKQSAAHFAPSDTEDVA